MVPGEPPPSDPSAQAWLLPTPGTKHAGTRARAAGPSQGPGPGRLEVGPAASEGMEQEGARVTRRGRDWW